MPFERSLAQKFADQPFVLIGVNSDGDRAHAAQQAEEHQLDWIHVWCGSEGTRGPLPKSWGVTAWPSTFLLDGEGKIRDRGLRGEALIARIEELLAEGQRGE